MLLLAGELKPCTLLFLLFEAVLKLKDFTLERLAAMHSVSDSQQGVRRTHIILVDALTGSQIEIGACDSLSEAIHARRVVLLEW